LTMRHVALVEAPRPRRRRCSSSFRIKGRMKRSGFETLEASAAEHLETSVPARVSARTIGSSVVFCHAISSSVTKRREKRDRPLLSGSRRTSCGARNRGCCGERVTSSPWRALTRSPRMWGG
jgi:hypothetical protein